MNVHHLQPNSSLLPWFHSTPTFSERPLGAVPRQLGNGTLASPLIAPIARIYQSRSQEFESGESGNLIQIYRQDVSNVLTKIKEKSKMAKPMAGYFEIRQRNK